MSFMTIDKLTFGYSSKLPPIIKEFSMSMEKGEIVGILGSSGSGKSTLLRLVAGLEVALSGKIVINGLVVIDDHTFVASEKRGVGMVFQDYALFPHMNVRKNIAFGLHRLSRKEREKRVEEMIDLVQLRGFESRYAHELSGGQQQRVALARALAPKPSLLLMDEPFSNLDADLKASIHVELREILRKADMTCMIVTHDQADVKAICDRSVFINA